MKPGERLMAWMLPHVTKEDAEGVHYRLCNTTIILRYDKDDGDNGEFVDVISLCAARQGQGDGTQALRMLTGMADLYGVKLSLYARAMDDKPHSTNRVIGWYERHGFEPTLKWKPIDADEFEEDIDHMGCDMFRPPLTYPSCVPTDTHA